MSFILSERDSVQILAVHSLMNTSANHDILLTVEQYIGKGKHHFVVDLGKLKYMNSEGLNFLLKMTARSSAAGGRIALANASEQVIQLLHMTKLHTFFQLQPSVEEAYHSLVQN